MKKRILIISTSMTGHGHKSITEALQEQFVKKPEISTYVVDGFLLGGKLGIRVGNLYGSLTRNARQIWELVWKFSNNCPNLTNAWTEFLIKRQLTDLLYHLKPDLILSVHPNFNGPVLNMLQDADLNIPFLTLVADLVNLSVLWADLRAHYIICPTAEAQEQCLAYGVPARKLKLLGFPIRSHFYKQILKAESIRDWRKRSWKALIMSGAEGSGQIEQIANILLQHYNCSVVIVAGRNNQLKKRIERNLIPIYGSRIALFGFHENIHSLMQISDIGIIRASPNVVMEAVASELPIIVTGALPGQEEGNPEFIQKHNLGIACPNTGKIMPILNHLLADGGKTLESIKQSQRDFRQTDSAGKIVDFICDLL